LVGAWRRCTTRLTHAGRLGSGAGDPKRRHRVLIDLPARLQSLAALELDQRPLGALTKNPVRLANVEPLLVQHDLNLPDFISAQMHGGGGALHPTS